MTLPFSQLATKSTTNVNTIEFGVNYKFNWRGPAPPNPEAGYVNGRSPIGSRVRSASDRAADCSTDHCGDILKRLLNQLSSQGR